MNSAIRGLGEVALQVSNMDEMVEFYSEIVGLELIRREPGHAFFRVADGIDGHTQVVALFDRHSQHGDRPPEISWRRPPLDHFAFAIALEDYDAERDRLERLGATVRTATHAWVGWRSLYVDDPEGNVVEWVCYGRSVTES